ncbi:MAG: MFS transporter [Bacteroidetes bacterium]|nr:MFS transporter [Bacteroidota bacterium]
MLRLPKGSKKLLNAWAFYDWANSVYSLVISSAIFPIYFAALFADNNQIQFLGYSVKNTAMISFVTATAFVFVAFMSPFLSGIADYIGNKKRFMKFFVYLGSISCVGLYWFDLDSIFIGFGFYFLALIGLWSSLVFYNSYLPDIAYPEQQSSASARGFSMGYIGSVLLLLVNLAMVMNPSMFGIPGEGGAASMQAMKYSFVMVGIWWAVFSQIPFYYLPKGTHDRKVSKEILWNGFKELRQVWYQLQNLSNLKRFLPAFFLYSTALQTVMLIAAYFGEEEIAWANNDEKTIGLIVSILLIQLVAVVGAQLTAYTANKIGDIQTLIIINMIWACLCVYAYHVTTPVQFYIAAGSVGMVMGGMQALSRATYSKMLPETEDTTSFFSFYDVTEKIGIIIGMSLFGIIDQITGSMRNSILFFLILFIAGGLLLTQVPQFKNRFRKH